MKNTLIALTLLSVVSGASFHGDSNAIELPTLKAGNAAISRRGSYAASRRGSYTDLDIGELREALTLDSADLAGDLDYLIENGLRALSCSSSGSDSDKNLTSSNGSNDTNTTGEDRISHLESTKIGFPQWALNNLPKDVFEVSGVESEEKAKEILDAFEALHRRFKGQKDVNIFWNAESKDDVINWLYHLCLTDRLEEIQHWGLVHQLENKMIVVFGQYEKEFQELKKTFDLLSLENERLFNWLKDDKLNDRITMSDIDRASEEYSSRRHDLKVLAQLATKVHQKAAPVQFIKDFIHDVRMQSMADAARRDLHHKLTGSSKKHHKF